MNKNKLLGPNFYFILIYKLFNDIYKTCIANTRKNYKKSINITFYFAFYFKCCLLITSDGQITYTFQFFFFNKIFKIWHFLHHFSSKLGLRTFEKSFMRRKGCFGPTVQRSSLGVFLIPSTKHTIVCWMLQKLVWSSMGLNSFFS